MTIRIQRTVFGWLSGLFLLLSLGMVRWPLLATYRPIALDAQQAAAVYELDDSAELPLNYYQHLPPALNQRTTQYLSTITRGAIYDRDVAVLAYDDDGRRIYTDPSSAHVVGHVSTIGTGISGIEATHNDILLGQNRLDTHIADLVNQPKVGSNLHLTIDSQIQQMAALLLAGRKGAIVVLDAKTGAIYASYSAPHYDAMRLLNEPAYANGVTAEGAMSNRTTDTRYAANAIAPLIAAATALDEGVISAETTFDLKWRGIDEIGYYHACEFDGQQLQDRNTAPLTTLTVSDALRHSADCAIAEIGATLPPTAWETAATRFGFALETPIDSRLARAQLAIGTHQPDRSPLQMAALAAAIANEGLQPAPHLIHSIRSPRDTVTEPNHKNKPQRIIQTENAAIVRSALIARLLNEPTAQIADAQVGGYITVAPVTNDVSLVGFVESAENTLAIVVLIESEGYLADPAYIFSEIGAFTLSELSTTVKP